MCYVFFGILPVISVEEGNKDLFFSIYCRFVWHLRQTSSEYGAQRRKIQP